MSWKGNVYLVKCTEVQVFKTNIQTKKNTFSVQMLLRWCLFCVFIALYLHLNVVCTTLSNVTELPEFIYLFLHFFCALISKINSGKLIQFIAFTYWPELLLRGGIMADWVCMKTAKEEGNGGKERKCLKEKHIKATKMLKWEQKPVAGRLHIKGIKSI